MEKERTGIIELFKAGRTHAEIMKSLRFPGSRRKFVYRTIRRYKETGGAVDRARSGRPRTVRTPQLKKVVRERIRRNPRRSMRKMALDLKISDFSIRKVVRTDLEMRSYKRKKVHFLSGPVKEKRLLRCKGELGKHASCGLENILFSDEKIFTIHEASNSQNDRIIAPTTGSDKEMLRYVPRLQKPLSVMVWAGISASGRTPLVFVPSGVKINASSYRELILEPVVKNLGQTVFNEKSFVFQQDGAPAHTANSTQDWLRRNIPGFISKDQWPYKTLT